MYKVYQVQMGDTLESIARRNNTTEDIIRELNNNFGNLVPGQSIIVPVTEQGLYDTYIVQQGDSMYAIAQRYGIELDDLLAINGIGFSDYIYPNQQILVPKKNTGIYVTKPNETLQMIATRLKVTPESLISTNENIILLPDQVIVYKKEENL